MPSKGRLRGVGLTPYRLYLAANIPLVILIFWLPAYHTFLWGAMGWGAVAAVVTGTFKNRPRRRWPWFLVARHAQDA